MPSTRRHDEGCAPGGEHDPPVVELDDEGTAQEDQALRVAMGVRTLDVPSGLEHDQQPASELIHRVLARGESLHSQGTAWGGLHGRRGPMVLRPQRPCNSTMRLARCNAGLTMREHDLRGRDTRDLAVTSRRARRPNHLPVPHEASDPGRGARATVGRRFCSKKPIDRLAGR
jgi:hypothetical protein